MDNFQGDLTHVSAKAASLTLIPSQLLFNVIQANDATSDVTNASQKVYELCTACVSIICLSHVLLSLDYWPERSAWVSCAECAIRAKLRPLPWKRWDVQSTFSIVGCQFQCCRFSRNGAYVSRNLFIFIIKQYIYRINVFKK